MSETPENEKPQSPLAPAAEPAPSAPESAAIAPAASVPAASVPAASAPAEASASSAASAGAEQAGGEESDGEGDDGEEGAEASSTPGEPGAPGAGGEKKKRRRRRKKKGAGAPGVEGATAEGGEGAAAQPGGQPAGQGGPQGGGQKKQKPKRPPVDPGQWPFGAYFAGQHRKPVFTHGEIVAGRVIGVVDGAIQLDLFGRGWASVDVVEPREITPLPEKKEEPKPAEGAAAEASADGASAEGAAPVTAEAQAAAAEAHAEAQAQADAAAAEGSEQHEEHDDDHSTAGEVAAPSAPAEPTEAPPPPEPGDVFRGRVAAVAESGHVAIRNRLVDTPTVRRSLEAARDSRARVRGLVYGFNRGGFDVLVEGVRVFCPASAMALEPIDQPEEYLGRVLEFTVPPAKPGTHGAVVSRRSVLEREQRKYARERLRSLRVGERIRGRVIQVRDFEIFVDLGDGLEGIVPQRDISFDRSVKPSDVAKVGDELEAEITRLPEHRKERHERVSLSLKATAPDPWDQHDAILAEGTAQKGKVTRVAEFGAFVELAPGIEGLLHVSELGRELKHAGDAIREGEVVDVVIERVDKKARRVALSKLSPAAAKALAAGQALAGAPSKAPKPGGHLKVRVEKVEHHGLYVQLDGVLGRRGRGYIPNSEMGTERGTDHRKLYPIGTLLDVKVIGEDRDGGMKMSRKGFINDEEKRAVTDYRREASKQGFGTFGDLLKAKLGK